MRADGPGRNSRPTFVLSSQGARMTGIHPTARRAEPRGALARLGRACAEHPWRTLGVWLAVIAAVAVSSVGLGGTFANDVTIPGSDAQRAVDLLEQRFPE